MNEKFQDHPTNKANFFSKVTLWWIVDLLRQGNLKPLIHDDLYPLRRDEQAEPSTKRLEEIWKNEMKSAHFKQRKPKLWKVILYYFSWKEYLFLVSLATVSIFGAMLNWYCVLQLSIVIGSNFKEISITRSDYLIYVYGVLLGYIFETIAANRYNRYTSILAIRARAGILGLIYKKVLRQSKISIDPGQVMELVCNDTQRCVMTSDLFIPYGLLRASQGLLFTGWLFLLIGWKMTPGIIVVILLAMFRFFIAFVDIDLRQTASKFAETRLGYLREVLTSIHSVKLNCLENIYENKIYHIRWQEIMKKAKRLVIMSLNFSSSICGQHLVTLVTVIVLVLTNPSMLSFEIIFPVTFLISYIIKIFCLCIPTTVHFSTDILTALGRIENFLHDGNFEFEVIDKWDTNSELSKKDDRGNFLSKRTRPFLNLQNVSFSLPKTDSQSETKQTIELLKNLSLDIQEPGLVVVCGPVGSGKTLLLTSMLKGELLITQGSMDYSGTFAHVSDTPWVFPGTVRENVLFGLPYDEEWYLKTIAACQLEKDFRNFPKKDLSLIGEHGATLSGGQRTRIALARAVYSRADIYLLDDPLSSLDVKVAEYIFKSCLQGLLTNCIVLLTSHTYRYLREADYVVKMDSGQIVLQGRFEDVKGNLSEVEFSKEDRVTCTEDKNSVKDRETPNENIDDVEGDQLQVVEEDRETGNVSFKIYWKFFINGAPAVLLLIIFLIVSTGQGLVVLLHVLVSSLPNVLQQEGIFNSFLTIYVILFTLTVFIIIIGELCTLLLPLRASYKIHNKMVSTVLKAPTWFFAVNPVGRILSRFSQDLYNLDELLPFNLTYVIYTAAPAVGALILCSISQVYLIPVAIVAVLAAFVLAKFFFGSAMDIKRLMQIGGGPLYSHFSNTMEGLRTIRIHNREQKFINILFRHADHHHEAMFVYFTAARWFGIMMDFVFLVFTVVVIIIEIYSNRDSSTAVIAAVAIMYSYNTIRNAQTGVRLAAEANSQMTSAERTLAYTEIEPEKGRNIKRQPPGHWPSNGQITFNNVSLSHYNKGPSVLKNLQLNIKSCEKIGIAGRTGAGKSSLVAAIMRTAETEGQILIDGLNIDDFDILCTRRRISVISQMPVLFNGTIRENLDPSTKIADTEIWNTLDQLEISSLIHGFPGKLDCKISGTGSNFSVGQRQLLHIARILLKKNKIIIFDEATGKIDQKTDQQIQGIIRTIFEECTVITISHRLSTIMECDRILVLDQGAIVEFDEPRVLLSKEHGLLRELFQIDG